MLSCAVDKDLHRTLMTFDSSVAGYRGWIWYVAVETSDAEDGSVHTTVADIALIPGDDALVAPQWVPWEQRLRPGDLTDQAVLPVDEDDPRLVPGYCASGDSELDEEALPIGYGRERVLSPYGRDEAASRWTRGEYGPSSTRARHAPAHCSSCGFYLPLSGALKACFGVCANELSADGRVVHAQYGCGAHSSVKKDYSRVQRKETYYDDAEYDIVARDKSTKEESSQD